MGIYFDQNNKMVFDCRNGSKVMNSNCPSTHNDWYLPSLLELIGMNTELYNHSVGNFSTNVYWSSSEDPLSGATMAQIVNIILGTNASNTKNTNYGVRAIRSFLDTNGKYALRDTGPAGGFIYHISGTSTNQLYFEAAPSDQSSSYIWSNITNLSVGVTGNQWGDGQNNTNLIIGQPGHTDSAAKLCDNLII
jgi:hypothetical protein